MLAETRVKFDAYSRRLAALNSVTSVTTKFAVTPAVEQRLERRIQESDAFLARINMIGVTDQSGDKVGIGVSGTIAGRTDTTVRDRTPRDMVDLSDHRYTCRKTEFDTAIPYARLDAWAGHPEFETILRDAVLRQQGLDRIMIGWNGVSAAAQTDRAANPLLQDVNIGWLQKIRDHGPAQRLSGAKIGSGPAGADYTNIDQAVLDAKDLLDPVHRNAPDLVCVTGTDLVSDKYVGLVGSHEAPTERNALRQMMAAKEVGGLPAVPVPFFPENAFLVTRLPNLSIYWQRGSRRRAVMDAPKRDRIEDYNSVNEDYVVEHYGACAFYEGILQPSADGTLWE